MLMNFLVIGYGRQRRVLDGAAEASAETAAAFKFEGEHLVKRHRHLGHPQDARPGLKRKVIISK